MTMDHHHQTLRRALRHTPLALAALLYMAGAAQAQSEPQAPDAAMPPQARGSVAAMAREGAQ